MKIGFDQKYLKYCLYVSLTAAIILIMFQISGNLYYIYEGIKSFLGKFISVISPFIIAILIAYVLNRPLKSIERLYKKLFFSNKKYTRELNRLISLVTIYLSILVILILIGNFIFPQLKDNILQIINRLPSYAHSAQAYLIRTFKGSAILKNFSKTLDVSLVGKYASTFSNLSTTALNLIINNITNVTLSVFNIITSIIVSFYLLKDKEKFKDMAYTVKKLYFKEKQTQTIKIIDKEVDKIVGQYIIGMVTEAILMGINVTIALLIAGYQFAFLIGLVFIIFNPIPYFGPVMAIAIAFLMGLIQGPSMAIRVLIVVFIIHLIDVNIIQPKIIGDKLGVEPLLVVVGIIVGGSYFGILGMLLAVPLLALLKSLIKYIINERNQKLNCLRNNESIKHD